MSAIDQWSTTAASNNDSPPDGWPEGMNYADVNDAAREMMAALAKWYGDTNGSITSGGSSGAYTLTTNRVYTDYADVTRLVFKANHVNTGAATLNVDGLGAKAILRQDGAPLVAADIPNNSVVEVIYDGAQFLLNSSTRHGTPIGAVQAFAGSTLPGGWAWANGQSLNRTTYADLFAVIGTTYGAPTGSTFNVPDLRGRAIAGMDTIGGSADAGRMASTTKHGVSPNSLGSAGGTDQHQLAESEMPGHTHNGASGGLLQSPSSINEEIIDDTGSGATAFNGSPTITKGLTASTGGDQAHTNVQPTMVMNWIIFANL